MAVSIKEISEKIKGYLEERVSNERTFSAVLIVCTGIASYGLGQFSGMNKVVSLETSSNATKPAQVISASVEEDVMIETVSQVQGDTKVNEIPTSGSYVASKNSDKYHLPWCSGAKRISEENKVWFSTKAEAEAAGYKPAGNCKGI